MKVEVYGGYHSPWVQAVLLALHDADVEHRVRQVPPFEAVKQWGVLMPAVSIDDGPWEIESSQILGKLGWGSISDEDLQAVKTAWQGVLHRPDNPFRFFLQRLRVLGTIHRPCSRALCVTSHAASFRCICLF